MLKPITLLAAASLMVGPAQAAGPHPASRVVSYGDLDLGSTKGRASLDARIRRAVKDVCGEANALNPRSGKRIRNCREAAGAVARNSAELAIARNRRAATDRLAARR